MAGTDRLRRAAVRRVDRLLGPLRRERCSVRGKSILLEAGSTLERDRALTYATKEPETLDWIDRYVRLSDVVYDVGANVGLYAIYAGLRVHGAGKVYAFEPEALNHAQLSRNIHLNGLSGTVLPCALALSDRPALAPFYLHPEDLAFAGGLEPGSALHAFGEPRDFQGQRFQPAHEQVAMAMPVDDLWQRWGLPFPQHLKVDVDGLEGRVIEGARATIADRRLRSALVEVTQGLGGSEAIPERFLKAGFEHVTDFAAHSSEALRGTRYASSVNHVFVRR